MKPINQDKPVKDTNCEGDTSGIIMGLWCGDPGKTLVAAKQH